MNIVYAACAAGSCPVRVFQKIIIQKQEAASKWRFSYILDKLSNDGYYNLHADKHTPLHGENIKGV